MQFGAVVIWLVALATASAELLPTRGAFEGTYHQDRWGVGHFEFFIVAPELLPRLKPYEGKPVRIAVTKGEQPINPGPAIMQEVAEITPLPESPLDISIETIPAGFPPQEAFQLVCYLVNRGTNSLCVRNEDVTIRIISHRQTASPTNPSGLVKGYTEGQLSTDANHVQRCQGLVRTSQRICGNHLPGAGTLLIEPGHAFPLAVLFDQGLAEGAYEFEVSARGQPADLRWNGDEEANVAVTKWSLHDVSAGVAAETVRAPSLALRGKSFEANQDAYRIKAVIASADGRRVRIVQSRTKTTTNWAGRVRAMTARGEDITIGVISQSSSVGEPAQMVEIPAAGLPLALDFRKATDFSTQAIQRVYLDLLLESGVETLEITESFSGDPLPALPPFGTEANGVKLRVRPANEVIHVGQPLKLHVQAMNVSGTPVCWWQTTWGDGRRNVVEIDGKAVHVRQQAPAFVEGWAGSWTCNEPKERTDEIPADTLPVALGQHTVRLVVLPQEGFYTNSHNEQIPLVKERLTSNTTSFTIE